MDPMNFMGLLGQAQGGDPETTGAVSGAKLAGAPMPDSAAAVFDPNSAAVPYDGDDKELAAYARMGIDPDLIRAKRADSIQRMAMILMGGGRGVDTSNQGAQLAAASDTGKDIGEIMKMKSMATRDQLEKGKLTMMQQKLLADAAQQARYNEALKNGASALQMLAGGGQASGGDAGASSGPSLAELSGNGGAAAPVDPGVTGSGPVGVPGGGRVDTSGLPGQGGAPRLDVSGTGAGAAAEPNVPAQPVAPGAQAYAAAKVDPRVRAVLTPQMAAILAAQYPIDPNGVMNKAYDAANQERFETFRDSDGNLYQRSSKTGHVEKMDARTQAQILQAEANKKAMENAAQLDFNHQNIRNEAEKEATLHGVTSQPYGPGQNLVTNRLTGAQDIKGEIPADVQALEKELLSKKDAAEGAMRSLNQHQDILDLANRAYVGPGADTKTWLYNHQPFTLSGPEDATSAKAALETKLAELASQRLRINLPGQRFNMQEFKNSEKATGGDLNELSRSQLKEKLNSFAIEDRNAIAEYHRAREEYLNKYKGTALADGKTSSFPSYEKYAEPHYDPETKQMMYHNGHKWGPRP